MAEPVEASVVMISNKDGRVLILLRTEDSITFPGCWSFPGGGADEGEDPFDCAAREVYEETSLKINPEDLEFVACNMQGKKRISYFITNKYSGDLKLDISENTLARWVRPIEIAHIPDWIPTPVNVILSLERTVAKLFKSNKSACD